MAPSEWGSGYEPLLRMGGGMGCGWEVVGYEPLLRLLFQRDFGRIAPFDDSISSIASVLDWFSHKIFQIRPKGPFSMNGLRICLKQMVVVERADWVTKVFLKFFAQRANSFKRVQGCRVWKHPAAMLAHLCTSPAAYHPASGARLLA